MTLKEAILREDDAKEKKSSTSNTGNGNLDSYINNIINNKNWKQFIIDIAKPSNTGGKASDGFYIKKIYVPFRNSITGKPSEEFLSIAKKIKSACGDIKKTLSQYSSKNSKYQSFIDTNLIPALENPQSVTKSNNQKGNSNDIVSPSHYAKIGEALVYRSSEFVSKLADSKTKINQGTFNQLLIDAFNGKSDGGAGENENFLMQFTDIDQKMRLDAAKQTVYQVEHNGSEKSDGDEQLGEKPNEDESYYSNLQQLINTSALLNEGLEVPRKVSDFSQDAKTAIKQTELVEKTWPRQFKTWYDKYQASFEEGVQKGQKAVRATKDGTAEKEVEDPLTGKKLKGRKAWGTGGPNAWIRDHEYINKLCGDIKNQKPTTIFNLGPKLILGIFDMIEHGGKILQGIKDDFGEAFKSIKKALRSGSTKEFNKQIDQLIEEQQYGAAEATAQASAVVQFSQLLHLLQNGPIGTVDLENKTFTTAMSNSQTSIEVAMQNLLAAMDKYTETEKRFEENKDVKINANETDSVVKGSNDSSSSSTSKKESDNDKEEDEEIDDSYKPTFKHFFLIESDDNDESEGEKTSNSLSDEDDESDTGITHAEQADKTLTDLELVKKNFDETVNKSRLKEVLETLEKFKGEEGDVIRDKEGNQSDFTNLDKIIELYKLLSEDDLKFNLNAASLKDFLDGLKKYLDNFKEIPAIENLAVNISENDTKWPAMDTKGQLAKETSGGSRAAELSKKIEQQQNDLIKSKIATLTNYARNCKNDTWLEGYNKTVKDLDEAVNILRSELENVYEKVPDWFDKYFQEFQNKNYTSKLYMLMACMTNIRTQLDNMSDEAEKNLPDAEESVKPKVLVRSLYLNENENQQQQNAIKDNTPANVDPKSGKGTTDTKNKNFSTDEKPHSVAVLIQKAGSLKLGEYLLPEKWNDPLYTSNNPQDFTQKTQRLLSNEEVGLSIDKGASGNGMVSIVRNLLNEQNSFGKYCISVVKKAGCSKLAEMVTHVGDGSSNTANRDLLVTYAACCAIANALNNGIDSKYNECKELSNKPIGKNGPDKGRVFASEKFDELSKGGEGEQNQDEQPQNGNTKQGNNSEQGGQPAKNNNQNGTIVKQSVQYPDVSPDSFLNEIYKYIRG